MENLTYDNMLICVLAMGKIAYNFWPCIVLMIGYAIWETVTERDRLVRVRLKSKNAKDRYRSK
jgi:hypothetical protein